MSESTTQHSNERNKDGRGSYAEVHGLKMYYEIHGEGFPLVLLHGGLSAIGTSFGKVLPGLARGRQVIAIEQQAHGHTADIDRPLTYQRMANDTIALLSHIGIERADFFGYCAALPMLAKALERRSTKALCIAWSPRRRSSTLPRSSQRRERSYEPSAPRLVKRSPLSRTA